jgi:hypothetical protein
MATDRLISLVLLAVLSTLPPGRSLQSTYRIDVADDRPSGGRFGATGCASDPPPQEALPFEVHLRTIEGGPLTALESVVYEITVLNRGATSITFPRLSSAAGVIPAGEAFQAAISLFVGDAQRPDTEFGLAVLQGSVTRRGSTLELRPKESLSARVRGGALRADFEAALKSAAGGSLEVRAKVRLTPAPCRQPPPVVSQNSVVVRVS